MVQKPININQDLLGYRLKERIGAGGYGEVWSAEAPGGIMKAVKIVFGYHDERRAQNELRSLDRIKALRHPFLLNLERIDIVDGQLVIITELADKSMADEFNEFVQQGENGIPRDYLLNQLMEAADALDYISEKHSLQHLDIKPENLLLVGRHIKVADFGLVKDLQDVSQSMMGGLTPAYAAPELFDGRPSNTSDQYSLAILFQEMLTGQRPFPGTTPAALAAQHMNGKPNLRPLPKSDQLVIGKALSKDSTVRFPNCVAMVKELASRHSVSVGNQRKVAPTRKVQDTESKAVKVRSGITSQATELINQSVFQDESVEQIDAPNCSQLEAALRPTLFIGIGNSANQVVRKLRQRMIERFGGLHNIPSMKLLCIDTDRNALADLCRANDGYDLTGAETLTLPLRKPEDYRSRQKSILNWLSRRWIYNVPRTLRTEGIRPLGRLALIDNFETAYESLQQAIEELGKPELLAQTAEAVGMAPGKLEPEVYIISSISGGSGSGMMNDLAYVSRLVLSEQGLPRDSIRGIMMHSTCVNAADPGLSAANSFAFLTELRHFTQFGFPGDDSRGLPDLPDEPPFNSAYYLDLGNDLAPQDLGTKFDDIAEYLFLSSMSNGQKFLTACRDYEKDLEHFALRSFGLSSTGVSRLDCTHQLVSQLCNTLVSKWIHGDQDSGQLAANLLAQFDSTLIEASQVLGKVNSALGDLTAMPEISSFRQRLIDRFSVANSATRESLVEENEATFGNRESYRSLGSQPRICQQITAWIEDNAESLSQEIKTLFSSLLHRERLDLKACLLAPQGFAELIQPQREQILKSLTAIYPTIDQLEEDLILWFDRSTQSTDKTVSLEQTVDKYLAACCDELRLRYAGYYLQIIDAKTGDMTEQFSQQANQLHSQLGSRFSTELVLDGSQPFDAAITKYLAAQLPAMLGSLELRLFHELVESHGGFLEVLNDANCMGYLLPEAMRRVAQHEIAGAAKRLEIDNAVALSGFNDNQTVSWLQSLDSAAEPYLDECGGKMRQAVMVPEESSSRELAKFIAPEDRPNREILGGTYGDLILVSEVEDLPLANVAFRLLQFRPDCLELTKRLHTRSDVDWVSLDDLF